MLADLSMLKIKQLASLHQVLVFLPISIASSLLRRKQFVLDFLIGYDLSKTGMSPLATLEDKDV